MTITTKAGRHHRMTSLMMICQERDEQASQLKPASGHRGSHEPKKKVINSTEAREDRLDIDIR
jgi:hypothetical protein